MCIRDRDQIVGHSAGEEFDVNVTFPTEYQAAELAGKAAVFKIKLHEVKYKEPVSYTHLLRGRTGKAAKVKSDI